MPSTSSFSDEGVLGLAVDPNLALTIGSWNLGLVFNPIPWVEGWRSVGALDPAQEDPDLSNCLVALRRAWAFMLADPVFPEEVWVQADAVPGLPKIKVGLS